MSEYEIEDTKSMFMPDKNIRSLEGIQYFSYLEVLTIDGCPLETFDLSACYRLKELWCSGCKLKEINDDKLPSGLELLVCSKNPGLTKVDVSAQYRLTRLNCSHCQISDLSIARMGALEELDCRNNPLKHVDLSLAKKLRWVELHQCQVEMLNLTNSPELEELHCPTLGRINLKWNPKIKVLTVGQDTEVLNAPAGVIIYRQ